MLKIPRIKYDHEKGIWTDLAGVEVNPREVETAYNRLAETIEKAIEVLENTPLYKNRIKDEDLSIY